MAFKDSPGNPLGRSPCGIMSCAVLSLPEPEDEIAKRAIHIEKKGRLVFCGQ